MRYTTVIFDIDGTLIDSENLDMVTLTKCFAEYGLPAPDKRIHDITMYGSKIMVMEAVGLPVETALARWKEILYEMRDLGHLYPGIGEVVRILHEHGIRLGIVSSRMQYEFTKDELLDEIRPCFGTYVCVEDVENLKPHPEPLFTCMKRLDSDTSNTLYIGDGPLDVQCANAAKVDFALATWGAPETIEGEILYRPKDAWEILDIVGIER